MRFRTISSSVMYVALVVMAKGQVHDAPRIGACFQGTNVKELVLEPVVAQTQEVGPKSTFFKYGLPQHVDLDFMQAASWVDVDGIWYGRLVVKCEGATSLNLFFSSLVLTGEATLEVLDSGGVGRGEYDHTAPIGSDGKLQTAVIPGGEVFVEFQGTADERETSVIQVESVVRGTLDLFSKGKDKRDNDCFVDVTCPEGDDWVDQRRSVVMFLHESGNGCTGVLLNNTSGDFTPYVHIANHCFAGPPSDPDNWVFYFNYERPGCGSGVPPMGQSITGARSIASDYAGDFHLLELSQAPPPSYHAYYAGWDRSGDTPTDGAFIGHPLTLEKKIGLYSSVTTGNYPYSGFNKPVWYADIDVGGIQGGSSGSPMFDENKRMVGHAMDGDVGCDGERQLIAPKLASNWEGVNSGNGLKDWLDPQSTNVSDLDGAYPEIRVQVKVLLQGAYDSGSGLMRADLAASSYLPLTEPYTGYGYGHEHTGGGESTTSAVLGATGNGAIVDWVVIELRQETAPYAVFATRSALLRRDGVIAEVDGTTDGIAFANMPTSTYRVAVRHRNHLGIMTAAAYDLATTEVDFSDAGGPALFGTDAAYITGSARCLWMGDANMDGVVKYTGTANDRDAILLSLAGDPIASLTGYYREDVNIDGTVKYTGSGNDRDPILLVLGSVPTTTKTEQLP